MKIRTDFVTNSSSSSFVVKIELESMQGKKYSVSIPPEDPDGECNGDLNCSAEEIMAADSTDALIELLAHSADCGYEDDEEYEDEDEEECEDEEEEDEEHWNPAEETHKAMDAFGESVKKDLTEIRQVKKITLKRAWQAWGEASSSFAANLNYDEKTSHLYELAKTICTARGEEKEAAKLELKGCLANYEGGIHGEWGGGFPSGFMGSHESGTLVWQTAADDIEKFAKMLLDGQVSNDDYAVETVEIDMQEHRVSNAAEYFLRKNGNYDINEITLYPKQYTDEIAAETKKVHKAAVEAEQAKAELARKNAAEKSKLQLENLKSNISSLNAGDSFQFGNYLQSGKFVSPIEWIILEKSGSGYLILSKYVLDSKPFHEPSAGAPWGESLIRKWLSQEFMQAAFIPEEMALISEISISEADGTGVAQQTKDRIFLLSEKEAKKYLPTSEKRSAESTKKAGNSYWGLRSYKKGAESFQYVTSGGRIMSNTFGGFYNNVSCVMGVRPAMWIEIP